MKKLLAVLLVLIIALSAQLAGATYKEQSSYNLNSKYQIGEEIISSRTMFTKTYYEGGSQYSLDCSIDPIHYYGDGWQEIDPNIISSERPNWDWEVTKGIYTLLIADDTTVALGKEGHWLGFRIDGCGYLDWSTKDYEQLFTRQSVTPIVSGRTITWAGIFGSDTKLTYTYSNGRFKEEIYIGESARAWLEAHPPSSYGLSNADSYLGVYTECDWQNAYTAYTANGTTINWNNAQEFIESGVVFKHPIGQQIVCAIPTGYAYSENAPAQQVDIRMRYFESGETHRLLFGANVLDLNALPEGPIVYDPTVDEEVGASSDDVVSSSSASGGRASATNLSLTNTWFQCGKYGAFYYNSAARFQTVAIPADSTINAAYMTLRADNGSAGSTIYTDIYGEDTDDAGTFSDLSNYQGRGATTASVAWDSMGDWSADTDYNTPDLSTVIQEIIDREGWTSNNDIVLFWDTRGTSSTDSREAYSYNGIGEGGVPPKLHVEYEIYNIIVTSSGATLYEDLAPGGNITWGLQLWTPTEFFDGAEKTGNVTLTASLAT